MKFQKFIDFFTKTELNVKQRRTSRLRERLYLLRAGSHITVKGASSAAISTAERSPLKVTTRITDLINFVSENLIVKILLAIDLQNDFISGSLGSEAAVAIVPEASRRLKKAAAAHEKIIFTRDTHYDNYLETREGRMLPILHCQQGTWGQQLHEELSPVAAAYTSEHAADLFELLRDKGVIVVDKDHFSSARLAEGLAALDKQEKITEIEIMGICTDICVLSNALAIKTLLPETDISVNAACSAGTSPEVHDAALKVLASCQFHII